MLIGHVAFSQAILDPKALSGMESQTSKLRDRAGYESTGETGVGNVVASVIQGFIALLGIIFVILIIYAGYNWMTAGGDEGKVTKAKDTLQRAIIGLIIIVAAYSITYFVFERLDNIDTGGGGGLGSSG